MPCPRGVRREAHPPPGAASSFDLLPFLRNATSISCNAAPQSALLSRQHAARSRRPLAKSSLGGPMLPIRDRRFTSKRLPQGIHGLRHLSSRQPKGATGNEAPRPEFPCRGSPLSEWQRLGLRGRRPWFSEMRPSIPYGSWAVRHVTTFSMVLRALDVHALQEKYIPAYLLDGWCQSPGQVTPMQINT